MTKEIINILNKMNTEKDEIRNCEHMIEQCKNAKKGRDIHISTEFVDYGADGAKKERVSIGLKEKPMEIVLNETIEYYQKEKIVHEKKLEELLQKLQNAPSGAGNTKQGE